MDSLSIDSSNGQLSITVTPTAHTYGSSGSSVLVSGTIYAEVSEDSDTASSSFTINYDETDFDTCQANHGS